MKDEALSALIEAVEMSGQFIAEAASAIKEGYPTWAQETAQGAYDSLEKLLLILEDMDLPTQEPSL
jgi:hypothetical protein